MKVTYRRNEIEPIQRRAALRCVSAYRTVSTNSVYILVRMPAIDLFIEERAEVYQAINEGQDKKRSSTGEERGARKSLIEKWRERLPLAEEGE